MRLYPALLVAYLLDRLSGCSGDGSQDAIARPVPGVDDDRDAVDACSHVALTSSRVALRCGARLRGSLRIAYRVVSEVKKGGRARRAMECDLFFSPATHSHRNAANPGVFECPM